MEFICFLKKCYFNECAKWRALHAGTPYAPYAHAHPTHLACQHFWCTFRTKIFDAPYVPIFLMRQNDGISNSAQIWSGPCNFSLVYLLIRTPVSHPDWGGGGGGSLYNFFCFLNSPKDAPPPPNEWHMNALCVRHWYLLMFLWHVISHLLVPSSESLFC